MSAKVYRSWYVLLVRVSPDVYDLFLLVVGWFLCVFPEGWKIAPSQPPKMTFQARANKTFELLIFQTLSVGLGILCLLLLWALGVFLL